MASNSNRFLKEHEDFVLKLKIKSTDGMCRSNQIRRVRLPRLADAAGNVSYEELVGLCVTFTFPEGSPENYVVSLTYFDVDEDTVTIASSDELVDAVEQFAEKKVLRISTEVKPKKVSAPASVPRAASASPSSTERGTSTSEEVPNVNPQLKNVLNTFVGILSAAVHHLQEGLAAPEGGSAPQPRGATATVTPVPVSEEASFSAGVAAATPAAADMENEASPAVDPTNTNSSEGEEQEKRLFIHGRHTCDSCLTTPIVGKRFHAKTLPDYDLCHNCFSHYTGTEVQFEEAELDRDRAFQERWHRRQAKIEKFQAKRQHMALRATGRRFAKGPPGRFANRAAEPAGRRCQGSLGPPCPPSGPPPPCSPSHHGPPPFGPPPPAFAPPQGPPNWVNSTAPSVPRSSAANDRTCEFDTALKEAIRRSLRDIAPKEAELYGESKPSPPVASTEVSETPSPIAAREEIVITKSGNTSVEPDVAAEQGNDEDDSGFTPEETKAMEEAMETASVDSEKLLAEGEQKPAAAIVQRESSNETENSRDESFHSEAVGSGDVAEAVGATLDLVAGMISDMLSEGGSPIERSTPTKNVITKTDAKPSSDVVSTEESPGALIVEQVGAAKGGDVSNADAEEGEWQVVRADSADEAEEPSKADEEIARAAEMLGSVLFNSDMKSSDEHESHGNVSNLSDSFSVPSTVPSIHVGATQRSRWSDHLSKLHELGFDNESLCVEILERLQAANIGVESEDDVSVTQVVNALLEQD